MRWEQKYLKKDEKAEIDDIAIHREVFIEDHMGTNGCNIKPNPSVLGGLQITIANASHFDVTYDKKTAAFIVTFRNEVEL